MSGLPKSIIKKYGVTKKAWSVFRNGKRGRRKRSKTGVTMAKKRKSSSRMSGVMSGIVGTAIGVGAYILFETMVEPYILKMANISNPVIINLAELGIGFYLARKSGVVGNIGKAAIVINLYQILYPLLSNVGNMGNSNATAYDY